MAAITVRGTDVRLEGNLTTQTAAKDFENSPVFTGNLYTVDLQDIDGVDSGGLALLVYWKTQAEASKSGLKFINVPRKMLEMADLGGLENLIFDSKTLV